MKFLQISDLHLGKRLQEYNLLEDQRYILDDALKYVDSLKIENVLLCGDIYDNSSPSGEATRLFDYFLNELFKRRINTFVISGNHDSSDKLNFGSRIMDSAGIHIVTKVKNCLVPFEVGDYRVYLLPFIRPADVNNAFDADCHNYGDAIKEVLSRMNVDKSKTNILVAHQTVLPSNGDPLEIDGSEEIMVRDGKVIGDVSSINASIFSDFDYVALGHIHKPMNVASNVRYAGSIFKYHKDEAKTEKSFTLIELDGKDKKIETLPIHFLHDVVCLEGTLEEILKMEGNRSAYIFANLKDKDLIEDPMVKLKAVYPYAAGIQYVNRSSGMSSIERIDVQSMTPQELFAKFYQMQNEEELSDFQKEIIEQLLGKKED
ncbi:MAG: exonuclease SbcCD subunit D [Bacilli bacterium]|nr:exonuclease SbcCD subunit D [Bacilli bacterium]